MRRKDRQITDKQEIIEIIKKCQICRLGLNDNGYPYILPLNFGFDADGDEIKLYFHSALEGHKVELIKNDERASFEMDTEHELDYVEEKGYCTFNYASVMGKGKIKILEDDDEKLEVLKKLMNQYHPGKNAYFNPAAVPRTLVYVLTVQEITAKRKQ
ncbi:MAG: pyridoxamine 5'-phosphate oxidase family protein [Eubacteriales bacterium]